MKGKRWLPSTAQAEEAVRAFFVVVPDEFFVVRCRVVGEAVARKLGIKWSTKLARTVRPVLQGMGAVEAHLENVAMWKGLIPRHFDLAEATANSNELRKRKRPVPQPVGDAL